MPEAKANDPEFLREKLQTAARLCLSMQHKNRSLEKEVGSLKAVQEQSNKSQEALKQQRALLESEVDNLKILQEQGYAKKQVLKQQRDVLEEQVENLKTQQKHTFAKKKLLKQQRDVLEEQVSSPIPLTVVKFHGGSRE